MAKPKMHVSVVVAEPEFGRFPKVPSASADAAALVEALGGGGASPQGGTSRSAVLAACADASGKLTEGDVLVVSFLGHGVQCPADEAPAGKEQQFLICLDEALSTLDLLGAVAGEPGAASDVTAIVVADACFGGGAIDEARKALAMRARTQALMTAPAPAPRRYFPTVRFDDQTLTVRRRLYRIAASPFLVLPGFTRHLAAVVRQHPAATYRELQELLRRPAGENRRSFPDAIVDTPKQDDPALLDRQIFT